MMSSVLSANSNIHSVNKNMYTLAMYLDAANTGFIINNPKMKRAPYV